MDIKENHQSDDDEVDFMDDEDLTNLSAEACPASPDANKK